MSNLSVMLSNQLEKAKKQAEKRAKAHGHKMSGWSDGWNSISSQSKCRVCKAYVDINIQSGDSCIYGKAVDDSCESCEQRIYKKYKDCLGTPVELESHPIGMITADNKKEYIVWKPDSGSWWGLYHLAPVNGGRVIYEVVGMSTRLPKDMTKPVNGDGQIIKEFEEDLKPLPTTE